MKLLKKLLGVKQEATETKIITVADSSEELTKRLREFDNQTLQKKIETLEKVMTFLTKKIEVQSEVIRRQSEAIREIHTTIEEIAHVFEAAQKVTTIIDSHKDDDDDDNDTEGTKKYLN